MTLRVLFADKNIVKYNLEKTYDQIFCFILMSFGLFYRFPKELILKDDLNRKITCERGI